MRALVGDHARRGTLRARTGNGENLDPHLRVGPGRREDDGDFQGLLGHAVAASQAVAHNSAGDRRTGVETRFGQEAPHIVDAVRKHQCRDVVEGRFRCQFVNVLLVGELAGHVHQRVAADELLRLPDRDLQSLLVLAFQQR